MTHVALDDVLAALIDVLQGQQITYAVIGGLAVNAYGFARLTQDADVCLAVPHDARQVIDALLDALERAGFRANRAAIDARLDDGRSLMTLYMGLTRVDLFLRKPGDTWTRVLKHRVPLAVGARTMYLASPEDLVAIKLVAGRPRDLQDAMGVVDIKRAELDVVRLRTTVDELATAAGVPELVAQLEALLQGPQETDP